MIVDMECDGQQLDWKGMGKFKATSGLEGSQLPAEQCKRDAGPVPEGLYKVYLVELGAAVDDGTGVCALRPARGIQSIPRGSKAGECEPYWANWGFNRARMEPADIATRARCKPVMRGGFYLHDSTKGYTHGCIEVEGRLFPILRNHHKLTKAQTLTLKVAYVPGRETNGGTKT